MGARKARKGPARAGPGCPDCPEWFGKTARAEWERVVPVLLRAGQLEEGDWAMVEGYCQSYARWREAEAFIAENGSVMTMRDDKGNVKWVAAVPQQKIAEQERRQMKMFAAELGLSPVSRSRKKGAVGSMPMGSRDDGDLNAPVGVREARDGV